MEISFVIPVYNGASCVEECIREILKWDKKEEIEIIVVDDGSDDDTWEVLLKAAGEDGRVKVMHIENSGQGVARNHGFQAAEGTYLFYADADDRVDTEEIYKLYKKAGETGADVTMGGYCRVEKSGTVRVHMPGEGFIRREGAPGEVERYHKVKTESAFGYVWNKLYRRSFLADNQLYMDDIRKMNMEDFLFNLKVWSKNPVFYCVDYPVYYYVTDNVSTTRKPDPDVHIKSVAMIKELVQYLEKEGTLEENMDMVIPLITRTFCWSLIKNIPYEGRSLEKLRYRACAFAEDQEVSAMAAFPNAVKYLKTLPSLPQRWLYALCLRALRKGKVGGVCLLFHFFYPAMKKYAASVLK